MILSPKIIWGLSWAGLALVLAVPSADILTSALGGGGKSAVLTSDVDAVTPAKPAATTTPAPVKTATVTTTKTPNGVIITPAGSTLPANPVDKFTDSGKALPDYISDGGTTAPAKPAATTETQVASIDPAPVAPTPFPAWARPSWSPTPAAPVVTTTPAEPVVIVDDSTLTGSIAQPEPVPPALIDDSANWQDESLRQYLERRGILEGSTPQQSSATVTQRSTTTYDPNGFYLSDGPNSMDDRELRRQRILEMLEAEDPNSFTLF